MYKVSRPLANELKQLSGWEFDLEDSYSLSSLLRKLHKISDRYSFSVDYWLHVGTHRGEWTASCLSWIMRANTPEDCVAKLCIVLFQQSILHREAGVGTEGK